MPDLPPDPDADVIASGREPPALSSRPGRPVRLVRLVLIALAAALAAGAAVALHYRGELARVHPGRPPSAVYPAALPQLASITVRLPRDGPITGTVLITSAAGPGVRRAQFTVSATITGGRPDTVYDLTGNDCSAAAPLPDHVWATGVTDAAGVAELTGHPWTGAVADVYWLALSPSPVSPAPGLRGPFLRGMVAQVPDGVPPCGLP